MADCGARRKRLGRAFWSAGSLVPVHHRWLRTRPPGPPGLHQLLGLCRRRGHDLFVGDHNRPAQSRDHQSRRPRPGAAVKERGTTMPTCDAPAERRGEAGFTLVEVLTAIVILIFGLMAVTNLLLIAASSNTVANQSTAAATSASRIMDSLRDTSFQNLLPGASVTADTGAALPCGGGGG